MFQRPLWQMKILDLQIDISSFGRHESSGRTHFFIRIILPLQGSSCIQTKDRSMRRCIASSWFKSDAVNGMLTKPNKIVGVTTASNKRKGNLIEMFLFVRVSRKMFNIAQTKCTRGIGRCHCFSSHQYVHRWRWSHLDLGYSSPAWWTLSFWKKIIRLCWVRGKIATCTLTHPHRFQNCPDHLHIECWSNAVVILRWHHDIQGVVSMHSSHLPSQRWIRQG